MALEEGRVGPIWQADGTPAVVRMLKNGAIAAADVQGRYQEAAARGNLYYASNIAAQAVSVALATTYTGLCLSNNLGNTKWVALLGCNMALSVAPAGIASLHLISGYSATANVTHTTPVTPRSTIIGLSGAPMATVDSAATVSTPVYTMSLGSGFTAGALYGTTPGWIDIGGAIIIPPGGFVAIGALTAVTGFGSFLWEEFVP